MMYMLIPPFIKQVIGNLETDVISNKVQWRSKIDHTKKVCAISIYRIFFVAQIVFLPMIVTVVWVTVRTIALIVLDCNIVAIYGGSFGT